MSGHTCAEYPLGTFKVTIVGAIIGSIILPIKLFFVQNLD